MKATRTRKPLQPVHGTCRMVMWSPGTESIIEISEQPYWLRLLHDKGRLVGVRLEKMGTQKVIDVALTEPHGPRCDCEDATYRSDRPGGCKHQKAVVKLLRGKGLLPEAKPVILPARLEADFA